MDGRFEEAVESLSGADSVERFDFAIRGLVAAKRLPNLSREMTAHLDFFHGYALYQAGIQEERPQTVASAEVALAPQVP